MMRDETAGTYQYSDDRQSEQGYYIWWDKSMWKKVRRSYVLRYQDLEDMPNMGNRRNQLGGNGNMAGAIFNAVPGLEKVAARGSGF